MRTEAYSSIGKTLIPRCQAHKVFIINAATIPMEIGIQIEAGVGEVVKKVYTPPGATRQEQIRAAAKLAADARAHNEAEDTYLAIKQETNEVVTTNKQLPPDLQGWHSFRLNSI